METLERFYWKCNTVTLRQFLNLAIPISIAAFVFYIITFFFQTTVTLWTNAVFEIIRSFAFLFLGVRTFGLWRKHKVIAYKIFSIAILIWAPGQLIDSVVPLITDVYSRFYGFTVIVMIIALAVGVLGIILLGLYGLEPREKIQILVHALTIGASVSFFAVIYVTQIWFDNKHELIRSHLANYLSGSVDLLIITICLAIMLYRKRDLVVVGLCMGLVFQAFADLLFLISNFQGWQSTKPIVQMFAWMAVICWVSFSLSKYPVPRFKGSVRSEVSLAISSYVIVACVIAFSVLYAGSIQDVSTIVVYSFLLTFVTILIAQITSFFDSKRLVVAQQLAINEISKSEEKYQELATHDPLTKLANRDFFIKKIRAELNGENIADRQFAIMFVDLDRFKEVNDTYGHQMGDNVIREVASRIKVVVGARGLVCRLGGDEFAIFLQINHNIRRARDVAKHVLEACTDPIVVGDTENYISCSIGIAYNTTKDLDVQTLLRNADAAMYRAKELGRNRIEENVIESELKPAEYTWTLNDLHRAIVDNQIEVYYQPIIDMSSRLHVGFEALARWNHPKLGYVPPEIFISVAEDNGLIIELGNNVIELAIRQLSRWQAENYPCQSSLTMNINLSFRQLSDEDLLTNIKFLCEKYDVSPTTIIFEMTESSLLVDVKTAISTLKEIELSGFQIHIDDFGTGYSSLSYLKKFPITGFKIDMSYIKGYGKNEDDTAIVSSLVSLAKAMDLTVTAEGVDSQATHDALVQMGCNYAQGFLYSKPVKAQDVKILSSKSKNDRKSA